MKKLLLPLIFAVNIVYHCAGLRFVKPDCKQTQCGVQIEIVELTRPNTIVTEIELEDPNPISRSTFKCRNCDGIFTCDCKERDKCNKYKVTYTGTKNLTKDVLFPGGGAASCICQSKFKAGSESVELALSFTLKDINNNKPTFESELTMMEAVDENKPIDAKPLRSIFAKDDDEGINGTDGIVFEIDPPKKGDKSILEIRNRRREGNSMAADVHLIEILDYETRPAYSIIIRAKDNLGNAHFLDMEMHFIIYVTDIDDNPPGFIKPAPLTRIKEDTKKEETVFTVEAEDLDKGIGNKIAYTIDKGGENSENVKCFAIHKDTGVVTVSGNVSRKLMPPGEFSYTLTIRATEVHDSDAAQTTPKSSTTECTVIIDDVNDCAPEFKEIPSDASIAENSLVGTPVRSTKTIIIKDDDLPENAQFRISITPDDKFMISPTSGTQQAYLSLLVKNSAILDYENLHEKENPIKVTITAVDVNKPELSNSQEISISIIDENDNYPQMATNYTVSIDEYDINMKDDYEDKIIIADIQATDVDTGFFGTKGIRYSITFQDENNLLSIDNITGRVTVSKENYSKLDREKNEKYMATIVARDLNGTGNANSTQLIVSLNDMNDNSPIIEKRFGDYFTILEHANPNTRLMIVTGYDKDKGENGTFSLEFDPAISPDITALFEFKKTEDNNAFEVVTKECLIGKGEWNGTFGIRAKDDGNPQRLSETTKFTIKIEDENDTPTIFKPKNGSTFSVQENVPEMPNDMCIVANDSDINLHYHQLDYNLVDSNLPFYIDDNHCLTLKDANGLDREKNSNYNISVAVCDRGSIPLCDTCHFRLIVNNTNDEYPKFSVQNITIRFLEESPSEQYTFEPAFDRDNFEDEIDKICYFITGGNGNNKFYLEDTTIKPYKALDYEKGSNYKITIFASNECENPTISHELSESFLKINILIIDINDNPPQFLKKRFSGNIHVKDNEVGLNVLRLQATDKDSGENAKMLFYQSSPIILHKHGGNETEEKNIIVNKTTGDVTTTKAFPSDTTGYITFSATVVNTVKLSLTDETIPGNDTADITIYFLNEEEQLLFKLKKVNANQFKNTSMENIFLSLIKSLLPNDIDAFTDRAKSEDDISCIVSAYFTRTDDNTIENPHVIQRYLDEAPFGDAKSKLKGLFGLESINAGTNLLEHEEYSKEIVEILIIVAASLAAIVLILLLAIYCFKVSRLKRQLKAANVPTYNSNEEMKKKEAVLPNTNAHIDAGSNPVWNLEDANTFHLNETNDDDDISIQSYENISPNTNDFEGGNYNEGFAGLLQQMFPNEDPVPSHSEMDSNFVMKNSSVSGLKDKTTPREFATKQNKTCHDSAESNFQSLGIIDV